MGYYYSSSYDDDDDDYGRDYDYSTEEECCSPRRGSPGRFNGVRSPWRPYHRANPTSYGWVFTGSANEGHVEFWEREERDGSYVLMDYYCTRGTVKTALTHPWQGKTQLFRRDLSERAWKAVLRDPRAHTGAGYQTRR